MKYEKWTFTTVPNIKIVAWQNPIVQTIYLHLCKRANQDWVCFPSRKILAEDVWVSENSIKRHTKKLVELGILRKTRRFSNNEETSSEYEIVVGGAWESLPSENSEELEEENGLNKTKSDDRNWKEKTPRATESLPPSREARPRATEAPPPSPEARPRATDVHRTKSTELNTLTKNNTKVLEENSSKSYWDFFINEILRAVEDNNWGITDWTQSENRRFWKMLRDKIKKLEIFSWDYYKFVDFIIKNTDEFQIANTTSVKKLYYNLATILAKIKAKNHKKGEFERSVLNDKETDFLWELW